jgi:hypothetical protein
MLHFNSNVAPELNDGCTSTQGLMHLNSRVVALQHKKRCTLKQQGSRKTIERKGVTDDFKLLDILK